MGPIDTLGLEPLKAVRGAAPGGAAGAAPVPGRRELRRVGEKMLAA